MINLVKLYLGTLKRITPILLLSPFDSNKRAKLHELYASFQHQTKLVEFPVDPYIIPKTDIFELEDNDTCSYDGVYECGFGHITEFELKVICHIVAKFKPHKIFEIGTFEGRTTLNMALNAPESKIFTLDLPASELKNVEANVEVGEIAYIDKEVSGIRFIGTAAAKQIQQLFGDSATYDFSPFNDSIDLMFIDGSHAHDYVINDTVKAMKMVKQGGIILWHDYTNWEGVRTALNNFYQSDNQFSKIKHISGTSIVMIQV